MKSVRFFKQRGQSNAETVLPQVQMWLNDATNGEYTIRFERAKKPPQQRPKQADVVMVYLHSQVVVRSHRTDVLPASGTRHLLHALSADKHAERTNSRAYKQSYNRADDRVFEQGSGGRCKRVWYHAPQPRRPLL